MRKQALIVVSLILFTCTVPTNAQDGNGGRSRITSENAAELVVIAELPTVDNSDISWSPDSRFLAAELPVDDQEQFVIWDTQTWEEYRVFEGHEGRIWHMFWSTDGQFIASVSPDDNAVRIWNIEDDTLFREFEHQMVATAAWSPDGSMISTTGFDEKLRVWDVETGEIVFEAQASGGETTACTVWSPDQRWLAAGVWEDDQVILRLWDTETWEPYADLTPAALGNCPIWSTDNSEIATLAQGTVLIYDVETKNPVHAIEQLNTTFLDMEWSFDNRLMATGAQGGRVMLWDMTTDDVLIPFYGIPEQVDGVHSWELKLSPDGTLLAAPTLETIEIWDTETANLVKSLQGHSPDVVRLEWSPDGTFLASTDRTGQVLVWGIADD